MTCERPIRTARHEPTIASQPPIGVLVSDDGKRILLDRTYVIGRSPRRDPACQRGEASPIEVDDGGYVSRVHAYVWIDGEFVLLQDNHSTNGTFIAPTGAPEWNRLGPAPTPLPPGWNIRVGKTIYRFEHSGH